MQLNAAGNKLSDDQISLTKSCLPDRPQQLTLNQTRCSEVNCQALSSLTGASLLQAIRNPFADTPTFVAAHDLTIMREARTDLSFHAGWCADKSPRGTAYEEALRQAYHPGVGVLKLLRRANWDALSARWGNLRTLRLVFSELPIAGRGQQRRLQAEEIRSLLALTAKSVIPSSNIRPALIEPARALLQRVISVDPDPGALLCSTLALVPYSRKKFTPVSRGAYTRLDFLDDLLELTLYGYREHREQRRHSRS